MAKVSTPAPTAPHEVQAPSNLVSFATADEWRAYSKGKGALGQQLMFRPSFVQAERAHSSRTEAISQNGSRRSTAVRFKGLTADDMIHLLLKLDHK